MTNTTLSVPSIDDEWDNTRSSFAYAGTGWYIVPIEPGTKRPAKFLGDNWQGQSTRDSDVLGAWFPAQPFGIGLHVGRSGAVVIDVDVPDNVPEDLAKHLWDEDGDALVPFQSSRSGGDPRKGHYIFAQPPGKMLGNSRGDFGHNWGEIRGKNGYIVVEPTTHVEPDGLYRWQRTGEVPVLPEAISSRLPALNPMEDGADAATDEEIEMFLDSCVGKDHYPMRHVPVQKFLSEVEDGGSRHESMVKYLVMAMREAAMGCYPAREVHDALWVEFERVMAGERFPRPEFDSMLAWAVGQVLLIDPDQRRAELDQRLREGDERKRAALQARVAAQPAVAPDLPAGVHFDPSKYFQQKDIGLDVSLLADDVILMGPLANGRDGLFWSYENGVWSEDRDIVRNRVVQLLGPRYRQSHFGNAKDVVAQRIETILCEPVEKYLNCRNGMVNWRTGEIEPHDPSFHSTVQFPFDWDGDAACARFDAFLNEVLSPDYVILVWQMIGYLMYSGNPLQVAFLLFGTGANGKGTLLRVLQALLGMNNCSAQSLTALSSNKFSAINLFGRIANIAGDIDATFQTETAAFKTLTGEDVYVAEHKYGKQFQFVSWAVPVFTANKIPGSADVSVGYLRRWQVIHFGRTFDASQRVPGLSDTLLAEIPGIAAKALVHLRQVLDDKQFKSDGEIAEGQDHFAKAIDQVRQWVEEACVESPGHRENRTVLYQGYQLWAHQGGVGKPLTAKEFYLRLEGAGHKATKIDGIRYFEGVRCMVGRMLPNDAPVPTETTDPWT